MDREALRVRVRAMAERARAEGRPYSWFEELYRSSAGDRTTVPWADAQPNPHLLEWQTKGLLPATGRALVVGCGFGDDAEELARRGLEVTAFDVSAAAIELCRRVHPGSSVHYRVADLFALPVEFVAAFDFVLEIYTLQALPLEMRAPGLGAIAGCVAPGGALLAISRGREDEELPVQLPWPLSRREYAGFEQAGLVLESWEDFVDGEDPPTRRFRALLRRPRVS